MTLYEIDPGVAHIQSNSIFIGIHVLCYMSYKCRDCELIFYSRDGLEVHLGRAHRKEIFYPKDEIKSIIKN